MPPCRPSCRTRRHVRRRRARAAPAIECASGADCPAGYRCLDNGSGDDPVLRRHGLQRGHRLRRRRGLPAVLHVRGLRCAPLRVPGLRMRRVRGVHRRRRPRMPPALHAGLGLSSAARRVRELDLRVGPVHQLEPLPVTRPAESRKPCRETVRRGKNTGCPNSLLAVALGSDRRVRPHGPPVRPSISRCRPRTPRRRRSARCPGPTISTSTRDGRATATGRCSTAAPRSDSPPPSSRRTRPRSSRRSI